jgi:hypothetical protein
MAYILGEDQLRLCVKSVILIVLVKMINDGDTGKHAQNIAIGGEQSPDKLSS